LQVPVFSIFTDVFLAEQTVGLVDFMPWIFDPAEGDSNDFAEYVVPLLAEERIFRDAPLDSFLVVVAGAAAGVVTVGVEAAGVSATGVLVSVLVGVFVAGAAATVGFLRTTVGFGAE
jgi:hypothetical protein